MTTATTAIANHLNIAETIIASVEEWASVLFVRFIGRRPRFVSKKVVKMNTPLTEDQVSFLRSELELKDYRPTQDPEMLKAVFASLKKAGWSIDKGYMDDPAYASGHSDYNRKIPFCHLVNPDGVVVNDNFHGGFSAMTSQQLWEALGLSA